LDYSYGLSLLTSNSIRGGTIVCSVRNVADPQFWADFRELRMTTLAGTPDFYHLIRKLGFLDWSLPSLRYFTQAGGALDADTVRQFARYAKAHAKKFFVMYGQTEATARISYLPPELAESHAGTIGKAIPGGSLEVDHETSELLYRGANIFGGYVTSPEDLGTFEQQHILHTGDLAAEDEGGIFRITGRLKRIVKILGSRVSLDEMEALLSSEFPAARFACVRVQGERVRVIQEGSRYRDTDLSEHLRSALRIPPDVLETLSLSTLPITPNGKTDYAQLCSSDSLALAEPNTLRNS
jgi:acyl-coenzyme A synthetase/AMP-(fatty) acid ligase